MDPLALLVGVCVLAVLLLAGASAYAARQRALSGRVGSFVCDAGAHGTPAWAAGVGHYCTDRLLWWRALSLAPRPARSWSREALRVVRYQPLPEVDDAGRRMVAVECAHDGEVILLRMSEPACAGFVSWLEAAPRRVPHPL